MMCTRLDRLLGATFYLAHTTESSAKKKGYEQREHCDPNF